MSITSNPNKSKTIEKAWNREISRKFAELKAYMITIPLTSIVTNVNAEQQAQINAFMAKFDARAIGIFLDEPWQSKYQTEAYKRGIERTDREIKSILTAQEAAKLPTLDVGATALINTAVHSNELDFLHDRANVKLKKWIDEMLFDTRNILHEQMGIVSVDDIHEAITDRINVTTSRARVINVTEVAQASQRSVIKEAQEVNAQTDQDLEVQWITKNDSVVRHLHARWHRIIMSLEQAARNVTISPWNCRCGLKVVIRARQSNRVTKIYAQQRKVLMQTEKAA